MTHSHLDPERAANLAENPHAGQGMVMLDIGGDIGAIVLHLPASLEGAEVEIEAANDHDPLDHGPDHAHDQDQAPGHEHPHRPHVAVIGRPIAAGLDYSAVFPELTQGGYALIIPGASELVLVDVVGGKVTETSWPAPGAGGPHDG